MLFFANTETQIVEQWKGGGWKPKSMSAAFEVNLPRRLPDKTVWPEPRGAKQSLTVASALTACLERTLGPKVTI